MIAVNVDRGGRGGHSDGLGKTSALGLGGRSTLTAAKVTTRRPIAGGLAAVCRGKPHEYFEVKKILFGSELSEVYLVGLVRKRLGQKIDMRDHSVNFGHGSGKRSARAGVNCKRT